MSKYELSLSKEYVPGWGIVDAVRELFQNALDQEKQQSGNDAYFDYVPETQTLYIGNRLSVLETSSLLLGHSTKRDDENTIGQFGEGYKVATLVLLREGKVIRFLNYGKKEIWTARFVKSRRYGAEILTFFVDKKSPFTRVADNNLTIVVEGITPDEYEQIKESNLHLNTHPLGDVPTAYGAILTDEYFKGKVFVNGLYVTTYEPYHYGYNFQPQYIKLDRDRKLVSDFELKWLASKMWIDQSDEQIRKLAVQLVKDDAADTQYITSVSSAFSNLTQLADIALTTFTDDHGINAIPVSTQHEAEALANSYKPIIVSAPYKELIRRSHNYVTPTAKEEVPTFTERLTAWYDSNNIAQLGHSVEEEFEQILAEMEGDGL